MVGHREPTNKWLILGKKKGVSRIMNIINQKPQEIRFLPIVGSSRNIFSLTWRPSADPSYLLLPPLSTTNGSFLLRLIITYFSSTRLKSLFPNVGVWGSRNDLDALEGLVLDLLQLAPKKSLGSWLVLTLTLLFREDLLGDSIDVSFEYSLMLIDWLNKINNRLLNLY